MIERVILAWLSLTTLVASNAVPQGHHNLQYTSLQAPILVSASPCQPSADQNKLHNQQVTAQNTQAIPVQIDETVFNDLFVNKILKNPNFQNILDSNVIHYNQNCHQNQRQVNTGATPSIINNYFILPTEFFNLNDKRTHEKTDNETIRSKKSKRKTNISKNEATNKTSTENLKSKEQNKIRKNRNKKGKKKSSKNVSENSQDYNEKETNSTELRPKTTKKIDKQHYFPDLEVTEDVKSCNDTENYNSDKEMNAEDTGVNINKRRKKKRKNSKSNNKTEEKDQNIVLETKDGSHLKDIESPVDNSDVTHLKENSRPTKNIKELKNSKIINTNKFNKATNKEVQAINPFNEDIFKNFYSNMYMGNNLFSNGYPFNFGQFYQPLLDAGNIKTENKNNGKTQNSPNVNVIPPKPIEVKLKPKKKHATTTEQSLIETEIDSPKVKVNVLNTTITETSRNVTSTTGEKLNSTNTISSSANTTTVDSIISKEIDEQQQFVELEIKQAPELQNEDIDLTKANLEMPPTLIEDLHEYMTPELGREDIVPTMHSNGIIDDYYPIFYENYENVNDENFYLKDLGDRHFYTTDRNFEGPLNRDRTKYDRYENYPRPNLDIKDRINFRRTNKFPEEKKTTLTDYNKIHTRRVYLEKSIENQNVDTETINATTDAKNKAELEDQFQIPPLLENPDFKTTRIEKLSSNSDLDNQALVYSGNVEKVSEIKANVDEKVNKFSRLINFEPELTKYNEIPTTEKPKSDKIETVYAKSKVVTYGVGKNQDDTSSFPLLDNGNGEFHGNDKTTYVVAKSLGHVDDYY